MGTKIVFEDMVSGLKKPGDAILANLTGDKADLWHMATGVAGEGGELLDAIKRHVVYGKDLDVDNVIEELGDLEFFMEGVRQVVSQLTGRQITRTTTLDANVAKLGQRYIGHKYSDAQAITRRDKADAVDE